jgi:hypothetical protein
MSATPPTNGTLHDHSPHATPPSGPGAQPQAAEGGRDSHGRFAQGNRGGPGNPFARQVAALRKTLLAAVTPEDLEAVTRELIRQAKEGNVAAAKLLLSYALGKPAPAVDPDALDVQEWEQYRRVPDPGQEFVALSGRMPLALACQMMRVMLPALEGDWKRHLDGAFKRDERERQREAAAREKQRARREAKEARKAAPDAPPGAERPKPEAAAPRPTPPGAAAAPPVDERALALLGRLLGLTPPSANGGSPRPGGPRPPSANGPTRPGGGGGPRP